MNCVICKETVPDGALMCPNCGAMPWQAPEAFLNEDQHKAWLDAVYKPQAERWERNKKQEKRLSTIEKELESLKNEFAELKIQIIRSAPQNEANPKNNIHEPETERIPSNPSDFEIDDNGVLIKYKGSSENVVIPKSVTRIYSAAFLWCENLQAVVIPDSVTYIGMDAFYGCKRLQSIYIPDSVTYIGMDAFYACKRLQSIYIPDSVICIGGGAFISCTNLETASIPNHISNVKYSFDGRCNVTRRK